jgi:hypothetical protein
LILLDLGARGLQGMVMLDRQLDGLFQRDFDRRLRERRIRPYQAAEPDGGQQNYPDVSHRRHCEPGFH